MQVTNYKLNIIVLSFKKDYYTLVDNKKIGNQFFIYAIIINDLIYKIKNKEKFKIIAQVLLTIIYIERLINLFYC